MKKLFLTIAIAIVSCKKETVKEHDTGIVDESVVLKPKEGYNSAKRANDYTEAQLKGKPVKNNLGNITDLTTKVISPYQIDLYFTGVRGAASYNIYRNDVLIKNINQVLFSDLGLSPDTKYKYQVAAVASNGVVGNLSNIAYGTTFSVDLGSKIVEYLSFNGDTTTSSWWTPYSNGFPLITASSGLTEEEQQTVTDGIAADWAQFPNVKVTRNRAEYLAADPARRTKTIFTSSFEWFSGPTPTAGGVSYLITLGVDIPNFVFSSALYYNTYYNICAGTHEDGHAIGGLHHAVDACDGQSYGGDGNHMGAAYHQAYRFWSDPHLVSGCTYEYQITTLINIK